MAWLRPILLLAGAVFIGLLVWLERRRPRQAQHGELRSGRHEPAFGEPGGAGDAGPGGAAGSPGDLDNVGETPHDPGVDSPPARSEAPGRDRERRLPPPVIDWSDAAVTVGDEPPMSASVAAAPEPPPDLPPLVVDWPPEAQRRIITLRVLPARQDRLAGRALRQGLAGCGFQHGPFGIFHLPAADGRVVLSAASLVRPGILDPATMDFQRFAGINLFAVLPGPLPADQALERLASVAAELADRVAGRVQDESGAPFNGARLAEWRQRGLASLAGEQGGEPLAGEGAEAQPTGGSEAPTGRATGQGASGTVAAGQAD